MLVCKNQRSGIGQDGGFENLPRLDDRGGQAADAHECEADDRVGRIGVLSGYVQNVNIGIPNRPYVALKAVFMPRPVGSRA
jgi:hypothetical protein